MPPGAYHLNRIVPDRKGHTPRYGSKRFADTDRLNKIQHLVGNEKEIKDGVIPIHQDANIFVSELEAGKSVNFTLDPSRQLCKYWCSGFHI